MKMITVNIKPDIPEPLKPLEELAHNLWISWNFEAINLFIRLDYDKWLLSQQNPVKMLGLVSQEQYEKMASDDSYLASVNRVHEKFTKYCTRNKWCEPKGKEDCIAYFSMEYGLDESLPIYSGGLGILSGDHLKSSSDLGIPLIGIGLLYRQGYFKQYLNPDGFQQELYPENDWYNLPVEICEDAEGKPVLISILIGSSAVLAKIWLVHVGVTKLYLLDTNIKENTPENRIITDALYSGDREMRIQQEILLGIGGIHALRALGYSLSVVHMNEGHSAFLSIERIRLLMEEQGLGFWEAAEAAKPTNIFTTHTPVPAGNERFEIPLMKKYFESYTQSLGLSWSDFLGLGRENPGNQNESFCLTVLALRLSAYANGVSRLHGEVTRKMWNSIWPNLPLAEVPIGNITNGVHPKTWLSHNMSDLLNRYLGPRFEEVPTDFEIWNRIDRISDEELWRTHERRRERLVVMVRQRMNMQLSQRGMVDREKEIASDVLSSYALTICFARRFATYKRGNLLLQDPERLIRLLTNKEHPVQLIFGGKAHPNDQAGKDMIKEIVHFARNPEIRNRIVFLEDYDMTLAKYMVSGSDVWLNTPRRPLEASGTSGMKAGINGSLNVSVLDGWWDEGFNPDCGWAIGHGETYDNQPLQDEVEGKALYDLLEEEIIPLFYNRGRDGLPREWIARMKASIRNVAINFGSHRMVMEYADKYYMPALANYRDLIKDRYSLAKDVSSYLTKLRKEWDKIKISMSEIRDDTMILSGGEQTVPARVYLGSLLPDEVLVELYTGPISSTGDIYEAERIPMNAGKKIDGYYEYSAVHSFKKTGRHGYSVRILPKHPGLVHPFVQSMIKWAELT